MKKAVKAKVVRKKIQICIYSRKLPESIKNAIFFYVIQVKRFKIFVERLSLVVILDSVNSTFSKDGAFSNDLKGVVMKIFPGGKPPDPHLCSFHSLLVSAPPKMNFVPTGLHLFIVKETILVLPAFKGASFNERRHLVWCLLGQSRMVLLLLS